MIEDIKSNKLKQLIDNNKIVIVDCYADWCHPCRALSPILEELNFKFQDKGLKVVKLDVDKNERFSEKNQITGIPCVFVYADGKRVVFRGDTDQKIDRLMGVMPSEVYEEIVEELLMGH